MAASAVFRARPASNLSEIFSTRASQKLSIMDWILLVIA
jgi:hypothetical protein